ncbi:hypothetical protein J6590_034526 [Homalodisca vitripennis]|nr:hypothetical protein J6590_034526 [Homalodisca vitripennis]
MPSTSYHQPYLQIVLGGLTNKPMSRKQNANVTELTDNRVTQSQTPLSRPASNIPSCQSDDRPTQPSGLVVSQRV